MDSEKAVKQKRQKKKKKSRTEVFSDSESEVEKASAKTSDSEAKDVSRSESKPMNDAEVQAAFTKYYMQRATTEFAEDLDKIRGADDFKDDALPLLIKALQQGTEGFGIEEQRRIVTAGMEKGKPAGD